MLKVKKTLSCLLGLQLALAFAVSPAMVRTAYADDPDGEPVMTVQADDDGDTQDPQQNRPDIHEVVFTVTKDNPDEEVNNGSIAIEDYSTFGMDYPMEYSNDNGVSWNAVSEDGIISGLSAGAVQIHFASYEVDGTSYPESEAVTVEVGAKESKPNVNVVDTESFVTTKDSQVEGVDNGSITIPDYSTDTPMEYSIGEEETWNGVPDDGVISGLSAGTVHIRYAAYEDDDCSYSASNHESVLIEKKGSQNAPTGLKSAPASKTITGAKVGMQYQYRKMNTDKTWGSWTKWKDVSDEQQASGITVSDLKTYEFRVRNAETADSDASGYVTVTVKDKSKPAAPNPPQGITTKIVYKEAATKYTASFTVPSTTGVEYMVTSSATAPTAAQWKGKTHYAKGTDKAITISGVTLNKANTYYVHARKIETTNAYASPSKYAKVTGPLTTYPAYKAVATKYTYKAGTTTHTLLNAKTYRATSVSTLNTALTAAKKATAKDPYVIHVLKGTYKLSKGIAIPANTYLVNESGASYVWTGASDANQMVSVSGYLYGGTYNGSSKVTSIIYFTKKTTFSGNNGIVNKATVTKAKKNGITAYEGAKNVQILNCKATYCIENGISIERGSTAKLIQGCTSSNNTYSGINLSHSSVTTIKNCTMKNNGDKGLSTNSDPISSWGAVGKTTYGCAITTMTGCTVQGNKTNGVYVKPNCKIGTFSNNKLINNKDGLVCTGAIYDNHKKLINKGPSTATVKSCTFSGNTNSNLHSKYPKAVITVGASNTFDGASKSKNCLMATEGGALKITGSNNVIKNAANAGISVTGSGSSVTISGTGTKIQTNGKQGIFIDAGKVTITGGNTLVSSNKDAGLWARNKGTLTMSGSGNKVTKNATYGAFARDGATMTLKGVNLSGNTKGATSTTAGGKITK